MRITTSGQIADLAVAGPNRSEYLNEASLTCVRHWVYTPALRDGHPVEARHTVALIWQIREPGSRIDY